MERIMVHWYLINPDYAAHADRAHRDRADAMSRAAYFVVVGFEAAVVSLGRGLWRGLRAVVGAYAGWRSRRLTIQALSRLDDRMLRDVGIDPGSIEAVAAELVNQPRRWSLPVSQLRPTLAPVVPLLRLDLDCPDLKHAA